jgi:hypothetical protein
MIRTVDTLEKFVMRDCYTQAYYLDNAEIMFATANDTVEVAKAKRAQRVQFMRMVRELETIDKYSYGPDSTRLWMRTYNTANFFNDDESTFWSAAGIQTNLFSKEQAINIEPYWVTFSPRTNTTPLSVSNFWFTISYHNLNEFDDLRLLLTIRRDLVKKYPQFKIAGYNEFDVVGDSQEFVASQLLQTAGEMQFFF